MDSGLVSKKKVSAFPYVSANLPADSEFVVIREDEPIFRAGLPDFWGGNAQADTYPLVVPLRRSDNPSASQHPRRRLSREWHLFVRDLNSYDNDAINVIFKVEAGWVNQQPQIDPWQLETLPEDELPKPEFIVSSGTVARIKERTGTGVLLDTFDLNDTPPPADEVNHQTTATRIVHFMAGHKDGFYVNISSGSVSGRAMDVYFPLMAPGDAWVHFKDDFCQRRIEFLPKLPVVVTANQTLNIREYPDVNSGPAGYIKVGESIQVNRYYPTGTGIWGEVVSGWVALQYLPYKGYSNAEYYTNWSLESIPPLRPRHSF